jgi:hypothetical protein
MCGVIVVCVINIVVVVDIGLLINILSIRIYRIIL